MTIKKLLRDTLVYSLMIAGLTFTINCSGPKQVGDTNVYYFEDQMLTFTMKFDFRHANTSIDSSLLNYSNQKDENFLVRIPKDDSDSINQKFKNAKKLSFYAKKRTDIDKYTIKLETVVINND